MLQLLLDAKINIEKMNFEKLSALHHAAIQSDHQILNAVLESDLNSDLQVIESFEDYTVLFITTAHDQSFNVQWLLKIEVNVNHWLKSDKTVLIIAFLNNDKSIQQVLLKFEAVHYSLSFEFQILDDKDEEDELLAQSILTWWSEVCVEETWEITLQEYK